MLPNITKPDLWIPGMSRLRSGRDSIRDLLGSRKLKAGVEVPWDPRCLGYDLKQYDGLASIVQEADLLDYASGGSDNVDLTKNMVITRVVLVADPYRHDVTTAVITAVQDAADKLLSGLTIVGGPTYFSLSSTTLFLKALGALNKVVYGGSIPHEDLATAVGADNDSIQAWAIGMGAFNDHDLFDITAGIPAEDETTLRLSGTFATSQLIATTAANGTIDDNTDVYILVFGVAGLSAAYRARMPRPQFRHDHVESPTSTTTFNLETKTYLKRTTIVNLAVNASNNDPRNDSNITSITFRVRKPTDTRVWDAVRWSVWQAGMVHSGRGPEVDRDGSAAVLTPPLAGVSVIDWRAITKNPYGLNLMNLEAGDASLIFEMGTTTGSIHLLHEYYHVPDPSVPMAWPSWRPD